MTVPAEELRKKTSLSRPHLVILGAGASVQAFPSGDANGFRLPLMNDLIETVGVQQILDEVGIAHKGRNFEEVYTEILEKEGCRSLATNLEQVLADYFRGLSLPSCPTLYDHLLLSLRPKDGVATFNWDPLLFDAASRLAGMIPLPHIMFLHGNVAIGYCSRHRWKGRPGDSCPRCGKPYKPSRLLYPIKRKDYTSDISVHREWRELHNGLERAYVLTIFGYGAPETDVEAIKLLRRGWGPPGTRGLEQVELIDTAPEATLRARWAQFIESHHYNVFSDFYDSWLARHPRRSCEAVWEMTQEGGIFEDDPIPRNADFQFLEEWVKQYVAYE
jgi:hypothetical protein